MTKNKLSYLDRKFFEEIFNMRSGYVLDFTNNSFSSFFENDFQIDIYDSKYAYNGESKANKLRAFWDLESNSLIAKVLSSLLEIWYHIHKDDVEKENKKVQGEKIIQNLCVQYNQVNEDNITVERFLEIDFQSVSIEKLDLKSELKKILISRMNEAKSCLKYEAFLSVIFLCGSILEGVLLGIAENKASEFNQSQCSPKIDNKVKSFDKWTLSDLINVASDIDFLKLDVKKFSSSLRDFRNYIHPREQLLSKFSPDQYTAKICFQVLTAAIADLSGER